MDNITHALAGMVVAECVMARRRANALSAPPWSTLFLASILANNLPDADFVYRGITPGRLGYLLHHRGHTHTCVAAAILGVAVYAAFAVTARLRGRRWSRADQRAFAFVSLLGPFLHIAMDFQNNYGVHPFWPFDDRWYYGDAIFIIEPAFWAAWIPTLIFLAETAVARGVLSLLLGGIVVAAVFNGSVTPLALLLVVGLVACTGLAAWRVRTARIVVALAAWAAVVLAFFAGSLGARSEARTSLAREFPTTRVVDIVRTPLPGNPTCWSTIAVGVDAGRYVVRRATIAAPSILQPHCPDRDPIEAAPHGAPSAAPVWRTLFDAPLSELRTLAETRCDVRAFLRFSRVPSWSTEGEISVGDLRFARNRMSSFAAISGGASDACPPWVPPWTPPRADLLGRSFSP
jgi:inner membrane protein